MHGKTTIKKNTVGILNEVRRELGCREPRFFYFWSGTTHAVLVVGQFSDKRRGIQVRIAGLSILTTKSPSCSQTVYRRLLLGDCHFVLETM
jgi:hypothetical protein